MRQQAKLWLVVQYWSVMHQLTEIRLVDGDQHCIARCALLAVPIAPV